MRREIAKIASCKNLQTCFGKIVYKFIKIKSPGERGNWKEWKQQNKIQNNPVLPLHKRFKLKKRVLEKFTWTFKSTEVKSPTSYSKPRAETVMGNKSKQNNCRIGLLAFCLPFSITTDYSLLFASCGKSHRTNDKGINSEFFCIRP